MKKKNLKFKYIFMMYAGALTGLAVAALFYVSAVLKEYEQAVPENVLVKAHMQLVRDVWDGADFFWEKYNLPEIQAGRLENGFDVKEEYLNRLIADGNMEFVEKKGIEDPDRLVYIYKKDGMEGAEITLHATSEPMTKLAILTYRTWEVESIKPLLEKKEYTLTVPTEFKVKINGLELTDAEMVSGNQTETTYNTGQMYLVPDVEIRDAEGREVSTQIADGQIHAEFYYFTLWLSPYLTVELNGQKLEGIAGETSVKYEIRELSKPQVTVKDYYGNTYEYIAGEGLPLREYTIKTDSRYKVLVNGAQPPETVLRVEPNPEFEGLEAYVSDLPKVHTYGIAVLDTNASIQVVTDQNRILEVSPDEKEIIDYTADVGIQAEVPYEVASKIDVLAVVQEWSLFMSNDREFEDIAGYLVKDCYQYEVAKKYAGSVDRKFFSSHTLGSPAFTDEGVERFVWITEDCFSVDVSFVKHMILKSGRKVDDTMNDRFFFVKWDDTDDGKENPSWKIVRMQEIVNHGE